jgi:hypothetical protein
MSRKLGASARPWPWTAASRSALSLLACKLPRTVTDCSPFAAAKRHSLPHPEWE